MSSKNPPDVPDLRSLLAEASRPSASVTVPLKQGLRERIDALEVELEVLARGSVTGRSRRQAEGSAVKAKAQEIESARTEMEASAVTFRFESLTSAQREQIRQDMGGRDESDELNLRAIAAMCVEPVGVTWTDLRDLRDAIGAQTFDLTIDAAADRASGSQWSVPFSPNASLILETVK